VINNGWKQVSLGSVLEAKYGKSLPSSERHKGSVPVYGSNGQVGWHDLALTTGPTIVIGRKGSSGEVNFSEFPCWPIDTTYFVDDPGPYDMRFAFHLLRSLGLTELDRSSAIPGLNREELYALTVPVPSIEQQRRISGLVDDIHARARLVSHRLASAKLAIDRLRKSVLAAVFSGRLTADWRGDPVDDEGIPSSWRVMTVVDLAAKVPRAIQSGPFGSNLLHSEFVSTGRLVIGIDNVLDGMFSIGRNHRISSDKFNSLRKYEARPLDVLITVMGTVGRVCTVPADIEPAVITKHVYRITVDHLVANPAYVALALRGHPMVLAQIQAEERGQTRPGINGKIVKALELTVPPLAEQDEIVKRVDILLSHALELESRMSRAESALSLITRAILAKVFNANGAHSPTDG
jgi:type I restriction enzyme S subunit